MLAPLFLLAATARIVDLEVDGGAVAEVDAWDTLWSNGASLNTSLAGLMPGDTLVIPNKTFYLMGGIVARDLRDVSIRLDGTLYFGIKDEELYEETVRRYRSEWPRAGSGRTASVLECMSFSNVSNMKITSTGTGTFEGAGAKWWGLPGIGYLARVENRPRLMHIDKGTDVLVEHIYMHNSPYWTFYCHDCTRLEVRHSSIDARRTSLDSHSIIDLTAFNTDGFDVTGRDIYIHDCTVWNQDDCFDVKDNSQNVLIENIEASGLGLTIGSIQSNVRNVTFRNARMHRSNKGIYMKFRGDGMISDVLYENIVIDEPSGYAIWIGPAQQSDSRQLCAAHPCSICWPELPGSQCKAPAHAFYKNITLRNVTVNSPKRSPGVLIASNSSPMENVVFEDVVVNNPGTRPFGKEYYKCENVGGVAKGKTSPVPPCFADLTKAGA